MRNYANMTNLITNMLIFLLSILGIKSNALAQEYICPNNAFMRDRNIDLASSALTDEKRTMKIYTGYEIPDEARSYCDKMIKEKNNRADELHIDDYDGAINKTKREIDELKGLLEQQTAQCNVCINAKHDAYEKKFTKKHGDHRYGTKGYRTKVVVVWGEAERIPTEAQAKYDLLYDEYMSEYDPSNDKQICLESTPACKDVEETAEKISSMKQQMSSLKKQHDDEIDVQRSLKETIKICDNVSKSIEKYNMQMNRIAFLKECEYPESQEVNSANTATSAENHQNVNVNSLKQANKAIKNIHSNTRSAGRIFGL